MDFQEPRSDWESPELIVLTRNHPEEVLLLTCKGYYVHTGAVGDDSYCSAANCTGDCYLYADS